MNMRAAALLFMLDKRGILFYMYKKFASDILEADRLLTRKKAGSFTRNHMRKAANKWELCFVDWLSFFEPGKTDDYSFMVRCVAHGLSRSQIQLLLLLRKTDKCLKRIAGLLNVSDSTIYDHLSGIYRILAATDVDEALIKIDKPPVSFP